MDPIKQRFITGFAQEALRKALRASMQLADVFPVPTHVAVVTDEDTVIGATVYFKLPNKAVWVAPPLEEGKDGTIEVAPSEFERKKHGNLSLHDMTVFTIDDMFLMTPREYAP